MRFDAIKRIVDQSGWTEDADQTAAFARMLETVMARTYELELTELKARSLFSLASGVDANARSFTYRQYEWKGEAKIVHNYAGDFPTVEIAGSEKTHKVFSLGAAYDYSIMDLRYAAKAGLDLDGRKSKAVREVFERKLESIAARGDANNGIDTGLFNAPNILSVTLSTKAATGTRWFAADGSLNATVPEILADVNKMQSKIHTTSKGRRHGNTLIVDTLTYGGLFSTARSSTYTDDTIGQYILKQSPWLKSIEHWEMADRGDGTNPRMVLLDRSPDVLELVVPQDFEMFTPQAKNMAFHVPCHMTTGGLVVNLPYCVCYADGVAS